MRDFLLFSSLFSWLTLAFLLSPFQHGALEAKEGHTLQTEQIQPIMGKIFAEHVDQKEMSAPLMQESIRVYITQFDPQFLYLLRKEVAPFWSLSPNALQSLVEQYNQQDYNIFSKLDDLFAGSIKRARTLRASLQKSSSSLIAESEGKSASDQISQKLNQFAENPQELERRWQGQWQNYMELQAQRVGTPYLLARREAIAQQIEEGLSQRENFYLSKTESNTPLSKQDQQHFFSLHVLKAIASSLDPHTAFFDDSEAFSMKTHLDKGFEGLGIFLIETPDGFVISKLVPDGPAEKSKLIHPGDQLVRVRTDDLPLQSLEGKNLKQVLELLRSDHNHPVTLVLKTGKNTSSPGKWVEARLTPEKITLNEDRITSGSIPFDGGIIGWITLNSFYEGDKGVNSTEDVQKGIDDLRKKGDLKGLVLDLRRNGGGYLNQAVKLVGLFIKSGVVVIAKYNDGMEHIYRDTDMSREYDGPLLILTSRVTASAAEIVAQALQDYGVALIAGDDRTYGKGTIQAQNVTNDASTSYFKVTVGTYYTVSGKTAQINGVVSDLVVPGPYSLLPIGEAYLQRPLPNNQIAAAFNDTLDDLDLFTRQWYAYSYMPYLQKHTSQWRKMLPELRKANQERIAASPGYQRFLRSIQLRTLLASDKKQHVALKEPMRPFTAAESKEESENGVPGPVQGDIQLNEALLIVEDMIRLQHTPATAS